MYLIGKPLLFRKKNEYTWINGQRKDYSDSKRHSKRNHSEPLKTHNMPTDDVENTSSTD